MDEAKESFVNWIRENLSEQETDPATKEADEAMREAAICLVADYGKREVYLRFLIEYIENACTLAIVSPKSIYEDIIEILIGEEGLEIVNDFCGYPTKVPEGYRPLI